MNTTIVTKLSQEISSTSELVVLMTEVIDECTDTLSPCIEHDYRHNLLLSIKEPSPTKRITSQPEEPSLPKKISETKMLRMKQLNA